jgi:hypothetical protein
MRITGKALRDAERAVHLLMGVGLLVLAFTPLGQAEIGGALRIAVAPLVVTSGVLMWQHARVTRALRSSDRLPIRLS